jgi:hypothetical protein
VHAGAADAARVAEAGEDRRGAVRARREHAHPRHRREVAHERGDRHVGEQRLPHLRRAEVLGADRLAGEAVLGDQARGLGGRLHRLGAGEPLDQTREPVAGAAAHDPLEEPLVLGHHRERRVAGRHPAGRVGEAQEVAVGDALAPAVLDRLVGERIDRLRGVPAPDGAAQRAPPAAEALDERREPEQVRARAGHLRQRVERGPAGADIAEAGGHGEPEEGGVVPRRPALGAHPHDLGDRAGAVGPDAALDRRGVLARERPLRRVVAAALGAEDEEAAEPRPVVDRPGVAGVAVGDLSGSGDRDGLGHAPRAVALQVRHAHLPSGVVAVQGCGRGARAGCPTRTGAERRLAPAISIHR